MNTAIYYFSGSGNSLAVARDLAHKMGGSFIAIPSLMDQPTIPIQTEAAGIVFPVYHATFGESGVPQIVERFIEKLAQLRSRYLFAVCTHAGGPGAAIENVRKMIQARGGQLAAGFAVKMSRPYSPIEKIRYLLLRTELKTDLRVEHEERQKLFMGWRQKLDFIDHYTSARRTGHFETSSPLARRVMAPWLSIQKQAALARYRHLANTTSPSSERLAFTILTRLADRSFQTNERCNGCGICARVCPVHNIEMVNQRPVWQQRCENCFACFQWCAKNAIRGEIVEYEKHDHHPEVKLVDMLAGSTENQGWKNE